jgi:hypothetical protein
MTTSTAEILREYGPFPDVVHVHGLTFDGRHVWFGAGDKMCAFHPDNGEMERTIAVPAQAGTALTATSTRSPRRIQKIDPQTGVSTIPTPAAATIPTWARDAAGGPIQARKIHQMIRDWPICTIESNRLSGRHLPMATVVTARGKARRAS